MACCAGFAAMASRIALLRRAHPPIITVGLIAAVLSTAWRAGVCHGQLPLMSAFRYGFSGRGLLVGHWSSVATSQFLTRDPFMAVSICMSLAFMLGGFEMMAGSRRAALVAIVCGAAGPLVVGGSLALGSALGVSFAGRTLSTLDYGASAITAGGGGALIGLLNRRWLTRLAIVFVLGGLIVHHQMADWEHPVSFAIGYGLSRWLGRAPARLPHPAKRRWLKVAGALTALGVGASAVAGVAVASAAVKVHPQNAMPTLVAHAAPVPPSATHLSSTVTVPKPVSSPNPPPPAPASVPLSPATLVEVHYPTPSLGGTRRAIILLPAGYAEHTDINYPVIEMLHGDPGGPEDVITGLNLPDLVAHTTDIGPFIAIAPDGHGPVVEVGDWADTSRQKLGAAVADDLRHWADTTLRTNGHWNVMGLSSGGYGAAYLGARRPGLYEGVCALSGFFFARSPAFAGESNVARSAASPVLHASSTGPGTLLMVGGGDPESLDYAKRYLDALHAAGQPGELRVIPGSHDWPVWKTATPDCLRFLLPAATVPTVPPKLPIDGR